MTEPFIALVGAGSALAGVLVTSSFTLLKGRQERRDKQMDRDEQRQIMHREARRGAYAAFITAFHEADRKLNEVARTRSGGSDEPVAHELPAAEMAIIALQEAGSAVSLEGPLAVATEARRVTRACFDLLATYAELSASAESGLMLWQCESPTRASDEAAVKQAHSAFVEAARAVLGGNAPGMR